jgi:hypothetical protein
LEHDTYTILVDYGLTNHFYDFESSAFARYDVNINKKLFFLHKSIPTGRGIDSSTVSQIIFTTWNLQLLLDVLHLVPFLSLCKHWKQVCLPSYLLRLQKYYFRLETLVTTDISGAGVAQSVCLATDWTTGRSGFDPQQRRKDFSSSL